MQRVDFVTVGWYWNPLAAWLVRNRLADEGLHAFVVDEFLPTTNWFYANAVCGIKVQVPASQSETAREILAAGASPVFDRLNDRRRQGEETAACGQCQSLNVGREGYSLRTVFLSLLILGFPLPIRSSTQYCYDCRHREGTSSTFALKYTIADVLLITLVVAVVLAASQWWMEFAALPFRSGIP